MSSSSAVSLPPHSIRVKRQRTDDPVPALYIENAKRRRLSKEFVFRLARTVDSPVGDREVPPSPKKTEPSIPRGRSATESSATASDLKDAAAAAATVISPTSSDAMAISPTLPTPAEPQPPVAAKAENEDVQAAKAAGSRLQRPQTPTPMVKTAATDAKGKSMDPDLLSPGTRTEIRRFHLSKRVKLDPCGHSASSSSLSGASGSSSSNKKRDRNVISVFMEGSGRVTKKRSLGRMEYVKGGRDPSGVEGEAVPAAAGTPTIKLTGVDDDKRKPRTHPMEKALWEQRKSREHSRSRDAEGGGSAYYTPQERKDEWALETDELTQQLQAMVMDYISNQPGIEKLAPTGQSPSPAPRKKTPSPSAAARAKETASQNNAVIADGGNAAAKPVDTSGSKLPLDDAGLDSSMMIDPAAANAVDANDPSALLDDAEGDWVYDVYVREELKPEVDDKGELIRADEDYGVLVISNSDDEEWWYDQDDEDSDKVFGSDDEDSNAEDYHTNDYPDEEEDDSNEDNDYYEGFQPRRFTTTKDGRRITHPDDEEYDLNDADDESDSNDELLQSRMRFQI